MRTPALYRVVLVLFAMSFGSAEGLAQAGSFPDRPIRVRRPLRARGYRRSDGANAWPHEPPRFSASRSSSRTSRAPPDRSGPSSSFAQPADGYSVLIHTNVVASEPWLKPTPPVQLPEGHDAAS